MTTELTYLDIFVTNIVLYQLRIVTARFCNRLVNLGISKQQHLYLRTKILIKNKYLTKDKTLKN